MIILSALEVDLIEHYRALSNQSKDNVHRLIDLYAKVDEKANEKLKNNRKSN